MEFREKLVRVIQLPFLFLLLNVFSTVYQKIASFNMSLLSKLKSKFSSNSFFHWHYMYHLEKI